MRVNWFILFFLCFTPGVVAWEEMELHWAYRQLSRLEPPRLNAAKQHRVRNPIDRFVLKHLEGAGLSSAPEASRSTLIRRAYFDLLGIPPTPEQVDSFVQDPSPNAWQKLIDTLLNSKHYGERWGRHWLDVARYADSGGYETDIYYRNAWRYRDYVVKSFNEDKPYDQFVQEQIAGDEIWTDNLDLDPRRVYEVSPTKREHLEARIGTGFYTLGPRIHESGLDAKRLSYESLTDWVDTTASAFMGLTLGCARCHDHKFDPFTQEDYFSLHAIFASAKETELPLWTSMEEADWRQSYPKVVAVEEARTAFRQFEKNTKGQTLSPEQKSQKQALIAAIGQAVLNLPEQAAGQFAVKYQGLMHIPMASVLQRKHPSLIKPVHLLDRGELQKPQARMMPALPKFLAEATNTPEQLTYPFGSRTQLAKWLTQPSHPLTARVIVNRIWQWHFGQGIVRTSNDFGVMGELPSHPKLLDWLAAEFIASGWKIKPLHRLIMNSSTYRQRSQFGTDLHFGKDPDNRLLWRMNRRRLEAEVLWDAIHSCAGTLNLSMGGPPIVPPLQQDEIASLRDKWHWVVSADPSQHTRRGIYVLVRRNFKFPMFEVFDTPVTSVSCPSRDVTTVAPQALWGLNNPSVFRQATEFAGRVVQQVGDDPKTQIDQLWRIALGRLPTQEESVAANQLLQQLATSPSQSLTSIPDSLSSIPATQAYALTKLSLAVFNLSEFAFID